MHTSIWKREQQRYIRDGIWAEASVQLTQYQRNRDEADGGRPSALIPLV